MEPTDRQHPGLTTSELVLAEDLVRRGAASPQEIGRVLSEYLERPAGAGEEGLAGFLRDRGFAGALEECVTIDVDAPTAPIGPDAPDGPVGSFGRFTDPIEIGRGGFGVVYEAVDGDLDRRVAVKVLRSGREARRFLLEAKVQGGLEHPGVVPIHELGRTSEGLPWFAMKRIRGRSLAEAIADLARRGPPADDRFRLLAPFLRVCDTLRFAHARGVVHRDLKPANVMIGEFGEVLVMDWGIAASSGGRAEAPEPAGPDEGDLGSTTRPGEILGTPAYMAPEQVDPTIGPPDARTDVYALGAMLHEILTFAPPWRGESLLEMFDRKLQGTLAPFDRAANVPRGLEAVVRKAMATRPGDRYPGVAPLQADVEAWQEGRTLSIVRYGPLERLALWARRHRTVVRVSGALTLALAVASAGFVSRIVVQNRELDRRAVEAEDARARIEAEAERVRRQLGRSLEGEGRVQLERGSVQPAAVLLAAALAIEESPARRALALAAFARTWRRRDLAGPAGSPLEAIAVSPDGAWLAAGWGDGAVHVLPATAGGEAIEFAPEGSAVRFLAWIRGADRLAVAWADGSGRVVERSTRAVPVEQASEDPPARGSPWSPDGRWWVRVSGNRLEIVSGSGEVEGSFDAGEPVTRIEWSPDGVLLAVLGARSFRVLDRTARDLGAGGEPVRIADLAWSPAGRWLAVGTVDGRVALWTPERPSEQRFLEGSDRPVRIVAWAPDGLRLAAVGDDGGIHLWSIEDRRLESTLEGDSADVDALAWSPEGDRVAALSHGGRIRIWDAGSGRLQVVLESFDRDWATAFAWHPDGDRLVWGDTAGRVSTWAEPGDEGRGTLRGDPVEGRAIAFSPDGGSLAVGTLGGIEVRHRTSGRRVATASLGRGKGWLGPMAWRPAGDAIAWAQIESIGLLEAGGKPRLLGSHPDRVDVLDWSPDGTRLATGDVSGTLRVQEGGSSRPLGGRAGTAAIDWAPDSVRLARVGDHAVLVLDARTGGDLWSVEVAGACAVAWSPGGEQVAVGTVRGPIRLFEASGSGEELTLEGHTNAIQELAWSPDGSRLASASRDGDVLVWDRTSGRRRRRLEGEAPVHALAWSPDAAELAAADYGGDVRVWDPASGRLLAHVIGEVARTLPAFDWSPDGRTLAILSGRSRVLLWTREWLRIPPESLRRSVEERTGLRLEALSGR